MKSRTLILLLVISMLSCSYEKIEQRKVAPGASELRVVLKKAIDFIKVSRYDSAKILLIQTDSMAKVYGNMFAISSVLANYGWIHEKEGVLDSALIYYKNALDIDEGLDERSGQVFRLYDIAGVLKNQSQFSESAKYYEEAFDLAVKRKDSINIGSVSLGLGNLMIELFNYESAFKYYRVYEQISINLNDSADYSIAIHNQGDALRGMGELEKALSTYKRALKLKLHLNRISSSAYTLTGLGRTYLLMDSIQRAEEVLTDAVKIRRGLSNKTRYAESLLILSRVSVAKKQYSKAESQLKEVEQIARDYNKADLLRDAFEDQRALYKVWGKFPELAAVDEIYDIMTDSLYREEKLKVQEAQSQASLQREQQKTQFAEQGQRLANVELDAESQKSQFRLILIIIAMMGLLVIAWQLLQIRKRNVALVTLNSRIKLITDNAFHSQKNALGLISALLRSKARQSSNEKELEVLKDVESKIEALGGVAKSLFQRRIEDNTAVADRIQLKTYLEELVDDTFSSVASRADLDLSVEDIETTSTEALNIGLITNEAVTNFSKYAEPAGAEALMIRVTQEESRLHLSFTDDGPGFPEDFDFSSSTGFGMQMMANLVDDMDGDLSISREDELTQIDIYIPLKA